MYVFMYVCMFVCACMKLIMYGGFSRSEGNDAVVSNLNIRSASNITRDGFVQTVCVSKARIVKRNSHAAVVTVEHLWTRVLWPAVSAQGMRMTTNYLHIAKTSITIILFVTDNLFTTSE